MSAKLCTRYEIEKPKGNFKDLDEKDIMEDEDLQRMAFAGWLRSQMEEEGNGLSPLDIQPKKADPLPLPPLQWFNYDRKPKLMKVTNTGYTVIVSAKWEQERPYLLGGPLRGSYVFSQMHFHWGPNDDEGSEHALMGESFPLELHVAFFKTAYKNQETALKNHDGMAILVYFYRISENDNDNLRPVFRVLPHITQPRTSHNMPLLALADLGIEKFSDDYFFYYGSVDVEGKPFPVMWFIWPNPITISRSQVDLFRNIFSTTGDLLENNFRPPLPEEFGKNLFFIYAGPIISENKENSLIFGKDVNGGNFISSDSKIGDSDRNYAKINTQSSSKDQRIEEYHGEKQKRELIIIEEKNELEQKSERTKKRRDKHGDKKEIESNKPKRGDSAEEVEISTTKLDKRKKSNEDPKERIQKDDNDFGATATGVHESKKHKKKSIKSNDKVKKDKADKLRNEENKKTQGLEKQESRHDEESERGEEKKMEKPEDAGDGNIAKDKEGIHKTSMGTKESDDGVKPKRTWVAREDSKEIAPKKDEDVVDKSRRHKEKDEKHIEGDKGEKENIRREKEVRSDNEKHAQKPEGNTTETSRRHRRKRQLCGINIPSLGHRKQRRRERSPKSSDSNAYVKTSGVKKLDKGVQTIETCFSGKKFTKPSEDYRVMSSNESTIYEENLDELCYSEEPQSKLKERPINKKQFDESYKDTPRTKVVKVSDSTSLEKKIKKSPAEKSSTSDLDSKKRGPHVEKPTVHIVHSEKSTDGITSEQKQDSGKSKSEDQSYYKLTLEKIQDKKSIESSKTYRIPKNYSKPKPDKEWEIQDDAISSKITCLQLLHNVSNAESSPTQWDPKTVTKTISGRGSILLKRVDFENPKRSATSQSKDEKRKHESKHADYRLNHASGNTVKTNKSSPNLSKDRKRPSFNPEEMHLSFEYITDKNNWNRLQKLRKMSDSTYTCILADKLSNTPSRNSLPQNIELDAEFLEDIPQSPINIDCSDIVSQKLQPLEWYNYSNSNAEWIMANYNGLVEIIIHAGDKNIPYIKGGPLNGRYQFSNMVFCFGSEHTIDNQRFSIELQILFFKEEYGTMSSALSENDGVVTVVLFLQAHGNEENESIAKIVEGMQEIEQPGTSIYFDPTEWINTVENMIRGSKYFVYEGSLTVTPYTACTWLIFPDPIYISKNQAQLFQQLPSSEQAPRRKIRPIQPLNEREIILAK